MLRKILLLLFTIFFLSIVFSFSPQKSLAADTCKFTFYQDGEATLSPKAGAVDKIVFEGEWTSGYYALLIDETLENDCARGGFNGNFKDQGCVTNTPGDYKDGKLTFATDQLDEISTLIPGADYTLSLCYGSALSPCDNQCISENLQINTKDDKPPDDPIDGRGINQTCKIEIGSNDYNTCSNNDHISYAQGNCKRGLYCDALSNACVFGICKQVPTKSTCVQTGKACGKNITCCSSADFCSLNEGVASIGKCMSKTGQIPKTPCGTRLDGKEAVNAKGECTGIVSGLGSIPTDPFKLIPQIIEIILGISGAIVVILIIRAGYKLMFSQGNPEKVQEAREELTSAIIGLLFIIFSFVLLQFILNDLLRIQDLPKGIGIEKK